MVYSESMLDERLKLKFGVSIDDTTRFADLIGKTVVAVMAGGYGIGLVVVNSYLRPFGLFSLGLARVEYVMAGVLWLFLAVTNSILIVKTFYRNQGSIPKRVLTTAIVIYLNAWLVGFLTGTEFDLRSADMWAAMIVVMLFLPASLLAVSTSVRRLFNVLSMGTFQELPVFRLLISTIFFAGALEMYAQVAYPIILPAYGGGKPGVVQVRLKPEAAGVLAPLQDFGAGPNPTYSLIFDGGDWLMLADRKSVAAWPPRPAASRKSVRVRTDQVIAIAASP
jgi:hypothetical protein